jgi:hypothetical protein
MLLRARRLYADRAQWLRIQSRVNPRRVALGIRSERDPNTVYLVTETSCTCPWWRSRGLGAHRVGFAGEHAPCKHVLAVRMMLQEAERRHNQHSARAVAIALEDNCDADD